MAGWGSKYVGQGKREEIYFRCKGYVIFCPVAGWGRVSRRQLAGVIEELGASLQRVVRESLSEEVTLELKQKQG